MTLSGNCRTTAMGILPHTDVDEAIRLAMTMDIPFWPQLPKVSFYEDMYVQVTENFPGIRIDEENKKILFNTEKFFEELNDFALIMEDEETYHLSPKYSAVYRHWLEQDLSSYYAIRGQSIGPISFGLKITDENKKPIIYNDAVKDFLYDFMARKTNYQYRELIGQNPNAFMWVDEPGLEFIFGSFTGYSSERARVDFQRFLDGLEGPKGVHLCGNPDWSFLLKEVKLDILSFDAFSTGRVFTRYVDEIKSFLEQGKILAWGIVPTLIEEQASESVETMVNKLEEFWDFLSSHGIAKKLILSQAWLAPSRCCLVNADGAGTVEKAYEFLREVSVRLKEKYSLYD